MKRCSTYSLNIYLWEISIGNAWRYYHMSLSQFDATVLQNILNLPLKIFVKKSLCIGICHWHNYFHTVNKNGISSSAYGIAVYLSTYFRFIRINLLKVIWRSRYLIKLRIHKRIIITLSR